MTSKTSEPKVGLSAEQWVHLWETDFCDEVDQDHHGHSDQDHHHDHGHGHDDQGHHHHDDDDEEHRCGGQNFLKKYLLKLTRDKGPIKVLVSLCGDSADVPFLANEGHNVIGIEVSEKAVKSIFENPHHPIPYAVEENPPFKVYTATNDKQINVYVGNFFDPLPSEVGSFDAIFDGHGIVSMPEKDMQPYADKLKQLIKPDGVMLFSSVYYDINELTEGPAPAPISTAELQKFFSGYKVELLEDDIFENAGIKGVSKVTNPINLVTKRQ